MSPERPTIVVAGIEFGWGSAGKLSAVLDAIRRRAAVPPRVVGIGSALGRPLLSGLDVAAWHDVPVHDVPANGQPLPDGQHGRPDQHGRADQHSRHDEHGQHSERSQHSQPGQHGGIDQDAVAAILRRERADAGLVVLDPVARTFEALGLPTVFVDSLPFLWTEGDLPLLPVEATVYCAQRCVELPPDCRPVLDAIHNLRWVEAVVRPPSSLSPPRRVTGLRRALVSLGGLRAPRLADWTRYPRLVLPPALAALADAGVREVHVAGNLPPDLTRELTGGPDTGPALAVSAHPLGHTEFLAELDRCDLLVASPGLTTLLEASSRGTPVVCLPPQNVSQVLNGRQYAAACSAATRVRWPEEVLDEDRLLASRIGGEATALPVIYGRIDRASEAPEPVRRALRAQVRAAVDAVRLDADWTGLARRIGVRGADQVADAVLALASSSRSSPARS
ncbi:hydroxymethylcytosylglucuronate/cytosylglucuronate synthase [Streptoalloteichus tenebrarius]|uniref:Hydroxymethylcytosylglucuronate/cytosylglucurona te synthase n=1 Tax=Streptoalloteichus tenebrarius (strain ATCC 17920 / DSM 40477 / JCM 4838 / CBS 697.72 / NBRC 16177 / NCIMB 11028 / NRRL B-12390 / A12253. 1 / ISP 5477) TaxID=1933 RepID=A0ABT1HPF8_STRSD|nr:hydroxymethylcytosylglucuronate/cytosylglucuronate synthase [Streptoalloteichus tenebrarius]MCP2257406.1 hydroxymethylcytosylglucuronate/cytosylglucuronate synthase [Streptoalloteichus tenebrarius]BFE98353.1 hypothetical protein GCM10020241_00290 [Streptoalloteichus tenebrarius]